MDRVEVLEEIEYSGTIFFKIRCAEGEGYVKARYVVKDRTAKAHRPHYMPPPQPERWSGVSGRIGGRMA